MMKDMGMTQRERMNAGRIYLPEDSELREERLQYEDKLWEFNQMKPSDKKGKERFMKEMFAECGEGCFFELPFHANWGGRHLHLGNYVYANFNFTIVDDGKIYIDDYVLFGPNVTIATANHPINAKLREHDREYFYRNEKIDWENLTHL